MYSFALAYQLKQYRISIAIRALFKHDQTIDEVGKHMEQKANGNDPDYVLRNQHQDVDGYGIKAMQRMKANATSVGLKDRTGE
jgi:hypothetical protein